MHSGSRPRRCSRCCSIQARPVWEGLAPDYHRYLHNFSNHDAKRAALDLAPVTTMRSEPLLTLILLCF
ncbi:hypothetical protein E4P00_11530 [Pseudomonas sp. B329]|nr:hypothetical protein [Pseudomonas sp. B329]